MLLPVEISHNLDTQLKSTSPKTSHHHKQKSQTTHIFKSKLPDIPLTNTIPLHTYCFQKLPQVADRPCLIAAATGKVYTYADTHLASRSFAAGLHNLGIRKGDVIMILLPNTPEFVFSFMAASMLGAAATTANPAYTSTEIMKQIKASKAKMVITQAMQVEKVKEKQEEDDTFVVITVDDPPAENCMKFSAVCVDEELPEVDIDPDDTVALPFSSGTTGLPKGVVLTHKSIVTSTAQVVDGENPNLYYKEEDVLLCLLPLFHIYAMHIVMLCALRRGCAMLLVERFEINKLLELIQRHRVSVAMVVPPLVLALAKNPAVAEYDLSSIRMVMCGAAPLGKDLEEALQNRLPHAVIAQAYGMTESGPVISMSMGFAKNAVMAPPKSGSCGSIVRNAEVKIVDIESGASLPYNMAGEICIRGQQIMKGYLHDEKATAAAIDAQGWLHTGDIGYVDSDHDIFIVDRLKEIIKFKGFQVPPAELEGILVSHPSIADAAVVPKEDDVAGEVPIAFVVRSSNGFDLTEHDVMDFIAKQVVFYKRIHGVYFINAIPKSQSGKISRKELKAKLAATN